MNKMFRCHLLYNILLIYSNLVCIFCVTGKSGKSKISYGGILNTTQIIDCNENEDIKPVLNFAISHAVKYWPDTILQDGNGEIESYTVIQCSVMEVIYTRDGKTNAVVRMMHPLDFEQIIETELHWGFTYKMKLTWSTETYKTTYTHSFTITEYIDEELYIFEHTFVKNSKHNTNQRESLHTINHQCDASDVAIAVSSATQMPMTCMNPSIFSINYNKHMCPVEKQNCYINEVEAHYKSSHYHSVKTNSRLFDRGLGNESVEVTILSFNIWNTNTVKEDRRNAKLYKERIKHLVKLCDKVDPDIIGFQEVRFEEGKGGSYGPNQVRHLSGLLKRYQYIYQPAQIQEHGLPRRIEEGVAIFSKYPITSHDYVLLSRDTKDTADSHQRILLHAEIEIPQLGPIHILNTHLSLSHRARQRTVVEIWREISKYTDPVFLLGDFNAEAHNDEVRFLSGLVTLHGTKTEGLYDTWIMKHGTQNKGFTFNTLEDDLTKRIDLIFMKSNDQIKLLDIEVVDDGLRKEFAASDHLGLLATFAGKAGVK